MRKSKKVIALLLAGAMTVTSSGVVSAAEQLAPERPQVVVDLVDDNGNTIEKVNFKLENVDSGVSCVRYFNGNGVWGSGNSSFGSYVSTQESLDKYDPSYKISIANMGLKSDNSFYSVVAKEEGSTSNYNLFYGGKIGEYTSTTAHLLPGKTFNVTTKYYVPMNYETKTFPANTVYVTSEQEFDRKVSFKDSKNSFGGYQLNGAGQQEIKDVPGGKYDVSTMITTPTGGSGGSCGYVFSYDKPQTYYRVTKKLNEILLSANDKGEVRWNRALSGSAATALGERPYFPIGKTNVKIDGVNKYFYASFCISSGSLIQFVQPDSNGNVTFWLLREDVKANYSTDYISSYGSGGGTNGAEFIWTQKKEKTFETPTYTLRKGYNMINFPTGNYKLSQVDELWGYYKPEDITFTVKEYDKAEIRLTLKNVKYTPYGDVVKDQVIDIKDAVALMQYLAGMKVDIDTTYADASHDGSIDVTDAVMIKQKIAGVIKYLD